MGGILDFFGLGSSQKNTTSTTSSSANYDLNDTSRTGGDGSLVGDGNTVNVTNTSTDWGAVVAAQESARAAADAAFQAITAGTVVSGAVASDAVKTAGETANNAVNWGGTLAGQALGVAVNSQTLQARLAENTSDVLLANNATTARALTSANDNATTLLSSIVRQNGTTFSDLLDANNRSNQAAAAVASNAADSAIASANRSSASALTFGGDALASINTNNRAAFGFGSDALGAALSSSNRAVTSANDSLDAALGFTRNTNAAALDFLDTSFGSVVKLVSDTAKSTQAEAQSTRDFAGKFVGDFYESQKSGDVQTLQQIAQVLGAVGVAVALAWALRAKTAA